MKFINTIIAITALTACGAAAPVDSSHKPSPQWYLKSVVLDGKQAFDGLYLQPYHTGAGFNALTFSKNAEIRFHLAQTALIANLTTYTAPVQLNQAEDLYAGWATTSADLGQPSHGFFVNTTTGYISNNNSTFAFGGWRICNWVHDVPELFWDISYAPANDFIPFNCAKIGLIPESIA